MNNIEILQLFLDDNSDIMNAVSGISTNVESSRNILPAFMNSNKYDPDVYVGHYFESIVPQYSKETFKKHFRLTRTSMNILLYDLIIVFGNEKILNMTVDINKKLHFTVWMLANHAVSFRSATDLFGFSKGTGHLIFLEICNTICQLKDKYICWPIPEQNLRNRQNVERLYGFPGVIGSIDGCHIPIKAPKHNPVDFYNRKGFHSVVLQAVCNNDLEFIDIFVGMPGRVHDARIFRNSQLFERIQAGLINRDQHLLGDSAYPLLTNVMTPYRDNGHLTEDKRRYNKKHSAARSVIERAFGILKGKFRRLKFLDMDLTNYIPNVVCAACVIYNIILKNDGVLRDDDDVDEEEERDNNVQNINDNLDYDATVKRNDIAMML